MLARHRQAVGRPKLPAQTNACTLRRGISITRSADLAVALDQLLLRKGRERQKVAGGRADAPHRSAPSAPGLRASRGRCTSSRSCCSVPRRRSARCMCCCDEGEREQQGGERDVSPIRGTARELAVPAVLRHPLERRRVSPIPALGVRSSTSTHVVCQHPHLRHLVAQLRVLLRQGEQALRGEGG